MQTRSGQRRLGLVLFGLGALLVVGAFVMAGTMGSIYAVMPFAGMLAVVMGLGIAVFPGGGKVEGTVQRPSPLWFALGLVAAMAYGVWFLWYIGF